MIELYDAARLTVKRDRSLPIAAGVLLSTAGLMAAYTAFLHLQLGQTLERSQELQSRLAALGSPARGETAKAGNSPRTALLADLQRQAELLEREVVNGGLPVGTASGDNWDTTPTPAEWMAVLAALAQADASLQKVDIERSGHVRIEGLATSPKALNALVQAWEQQDAVAFVQARSIEVKQEKLPAPYLRFQLRGTPVPAVASTLPAAGKAPGRAASGAISASSAASAARAEAQP